MVSEEFIDTSGGFPTIDGHSISHPRSIVSFVIPIVVVMIAEGLLFFGFLEYALWVHALALFGFTLVPLVVDTDIPLLRAFTFIPVFRLVNLGMPVFFELTLYWFPLIYGPLIPALYLLMRRQASVEAAFHPRQTLLLAPPAIAFSGLLGVVEYGIIEPDALIPEWSVLQVLLITVVMIGFVGLVEELLFRGVLQRTLQTRIGRWPGLVVASALFGMMHAGYGVFGEIVFAAIIGFVFGLIYDWTDSIALISILHGTLNVFLFAIIPIQGASIGALLGVLAFV